MLRDIDDALRDIARIQRERQADNSDTILSDRIHGSPSSTDCAGQHGSQLKSLKPEYCAQIGQVLKPFWYTTQHAQENLGQFKKEIRKWERTIAFVDEGDVPDDSDSVRAVL